MNRANKITFNKGGRILLQTGEASCNVLEHDIVTRLNYLDLEYVNIDYSKQDSI